MGSSGLTWAKLHDPDCGMITVWAVFAAEWFLFLFNAWYLDQVCYHQFYFMYIACQDEFV